MIAFATQPERAPDRFSASNRGSPGKEPIGSRLAQLRGVTRTFPSPGLAPAELRAA
jgi:hypothetical protein